jgi:hypothetical protein
MNEMDFLMFIPLVQKSFKFRQDMLCTIQYYVSVTYYIEVLLFNACDSPRPDDEVDPVPHLGLHEVQDGRDLESI